MASVYTILKCHDPGIQYERSPIVEQVCLGAEVAHGCFCDTHVQDVYPGLRSAIYSGFSGRALTAPQPDRARSTSWRQTTLLTAGSGLAGKRALMATYE